MSSATTSSQNSSHSDHSIHHPWVVRLIVQASWGPMVGVEAYAERSADHETDLHHNHKPGRFTPERSGNGPAPTTPPAKRLSTGLVSSPRRFLGIPMSSLICEVQMLHVATDAVMKIYRGGLMRAGRRTPPRIEIAVDRWVDAYRTKTEVTSCGLNAEKLHW